MATEIKLTRKDFVSDQTVRWCPGCGDYAILATVQKTFPRLGIPKENFVVVSGIGCSSRFPYYMDTYGIHSIHGRAPTLATGIKLSNPELSVWVVTGDGDALSIGGNHILHAGRRNVDLNILLFNNRIYGLTKGQLSPTSPVGTKTKSSPYGSIERPLNPVEVALASGATYVARTIDVLQKEMGEIMYQGALHKGLAVTEIMQNCVIFNNGAWFDYSDRSKRADNDLFLEAGKPMIFGKNKDKGLVHSDDGFKVVEIGDEYSIEDIAVHDPTSLDNAFLLSQLTYPLPLGIIYQVTKPTYCEGMWGQIEQVKAQKGVGDLNALYRSADTWTVVKEGEPEIKAEVRGDVESNLDEAYVDEVLGREPLEADLAEQLSGLTLYDLNPKAPITIEPTARMDHALYLMREHRIGALLVVAPDRHLTGIITEVDIQERLAGTDMNLHDVTVQEFMTPHPVALPLDASVLEAVHFMTTKRFRHLPVVDDTLRPVGVISSRDLVEYLVKHL